MVKQIARVLLLVALLTAIVISGAPAFATSDACLCISLGGKNGQTHGGCAFDKKTSQCVVTGCPGYCL